MHLCILFPQALVLHLDIITASCLFPTFLRNLTSSAILTHFSKWEIRIGLILSHIFKSTYLPITSKLGGMCLSQVNIDHSLTRINCDAMDGSVQCHVVPIALYSMALLNIQL